MENAIFAAGIARVDITPPVGVWMGGFAVRDHVSTSVHDPLYATALVLANGSTKVALVTCDLLALDAGCVAAIRRAATEATGIPETNILIHCIHTHAGPIVSDMYGFGARDTAYESVMTRQITTAICLAHSKLEPACLTFGFSSADVGINRRNRSKGDVQIGENHAGPVDHRVGALGIWDGKDQKKLIGALIWAAVHPVVLGGQNYAFSRDFPGYAINRIEQAFPGAKTLYFTGPCGDVNPRKFTGNDRFEMAHKAGDLIAGAAFTALADGRMVPSQTLAVAQHHVQVPLAALPSEQELLLFAEKQKERVLSAEGNAELRLSMDGLYQWSKAALAAVRNEPTDLIAVTDLRAELQAIAIGDITLTALPFEVFTEYGEIAARTAPGVTSLLIGYGNGDFGYLPTAQAFAEGGYEVESAHKYYKLPKFTAEIQQLVSAGIAALHNDLQAQL